MKKTLCCILTFAMCLVSPLDFMVSHAKASDFYQKTIWVNYGSTMVIKSDGSLWGWGKNGGLLGDGTTIDRTTPVKIMDSARSVVEYGMAIQEDGTL